MKFQFNFFNHRRILGRDYVTEEWKRQATASEYLLAYSKPLDQVLVPSEIRIAKIIQKSSSLPYQLQEAAARVMILYVNLEMPCKMLDALAQERNLHLWRSGVRRMNPELLDDLLFLRFSSSHISVFFSLFPYLIVIFLPYRSPLVKQHHPNRAIPVICITAISGNEFTLPLSSPRQTKMVDWPQL